MSPFTLVIGICCDWLRGTTRCLGIWHVASNKKLLPVAIIVSVLGIALLFAGYVEIGDALAGLAGAMTLLEGYLRHKSARGASPKDSA
jgi:hypothetical protein